MLKKYDLWQEDKIIQDYANSIESMENRVLQISQNQANNLIWLLEYEHLFTAGRSAQSNDLLNSENVPVFHTNRGGKHTYHGPGQQICYLIIDLKELFNNKPDLRKFIEMIAQINIAVLEYFDIDARFDEQNIGIWVENKKITSIGIRLKKWISMHGFALNINTDLRYFQGIVPCGIQGCQITSIQQILGKKIDMHLIQKLIIEKTCQIFEIKTLNKI